MSDFFDAIRRFLLDYLPKQRCLSKNTILSYRQTLNIFVAYMRDEIGIGAAELTFSRVDRDVILNFLTWLEKARGCSVSTREPPWREYCRQKDTMTSAYNRFVQRSPGKTAMPLNAGCG